MSKTVKKQLSTYASVLGLGVVLVFAGCVKQHDKRASQSNLASQSKRYAITEGTFSDVEGASVQSLSGTYQVATDYLGCEAVPANATLGTFTANDKVIVTFGGKKAACVKPSSLKSLLNRPTVTLEGNLEDSPYWIQTRQVVRPSGRTVALDGVEAEEGTGIKLLNIVEFSTNSPILQAITDRVELRALPGQRYKVYHKLVNEYIYIMMVTPKAKMSHLDMPVSDNLGNGMYAVPIAWGGIKLLKQELALNSDYETTNVVTYNTVQTLKDATHVDIDLEGVTGIDLKSYVAIEDLYPADYFTKGQWYFSESVVDTRPGSEGFIGTTTGAYDTSFRSATRVQFTRRSTGLVACNVSIDQRYGDDETCDKSDSVLTIPGVGLAYGIVPEEGKIRSYDVLSAQAPLYRIVLDHTSSVRKSIDELISVIRDTNTDQVINIKFYKNKFSFVVQRGTNGRRIMYSFLKTDGRAPYATRRHYKDDRQSKFGYFVQEVSKIRSTDVIAREEDLEKDYLVQRHNPTKDIIFHFSNLTPDYKKGDDPYGLEIDYRKIGRNSIEYWNKAYKRAGAPNQVLMNEEVDAPFGDIAYNTINLIDSEKGSNLLGVGPSLVDPYSGEVINANANVYIAPFREIIAGQVRNYIKARTGLLNEPKKQLPGGATLNSTLLGEMAESTLGIKDVLATIVPENVMKMVANFYHHGVVDFTTDDIGTGGFASNTDVITDLYGLTKFNSETSLIKNLGIIAERVPELVFLRDQGDITFKPRSRKELLKLQQALESHRPTFYRSYFMSDTGLASDYNSMTGQIEEQCGEVLKLVALIKNRSEAENKPAHMTTAEELPALRHCMTQIIPGKFQATLIHEIGHTLGLRHNFYASADKENFFKKEEVKELYGLDIAEHDLPRSSSVMDYVRTEQDRLTYPGHYDIAAIRYGYANTVEVVSDAKRPNTLGGTYVVLKKADTNNTAGSILDELKEKGQVLAPFAYCTDVEASLEIDPLCARHDFGTTPKMIVEDSINSFWESLTLYNFRYDRGKAAVTGPFRRASRLDKLKRIYTEWRVHLANHLGKKDTTGNIYLQRYGKDEYVALLDELRADPNFKGKDYLAARDEIFDFILDVAFFPNKYCLVGTDAGLKAYEFDKLRDELKNQVPQGTQVSSCEDQYMQDLITSKGQTYYLEAGLPVDNLWYAVNPQDTFQENVDFSSFRAPLDVVGSFLDRYFASAFLGGRQAGYTGLLEKMFPNMMDEPDLYEKFEARILQRLTKGVDLRNVFERANDIALPAEANLVLPNYSSESALLKGLWLSLEQGIRNPYVNSSSKSFKYTRTFTDNLDQINDARDNGAFVMPLTSGESLVVRKEATVVFALAEALVGVSQTFQGANEEIPTVEQMTGGLEPVMKGIADKLTLEAGATQITVDQYLEFARELSAIKRSVPVIMDSMLEQAYIADLATYIIFLQSADEAVQAALQAGQTPPPEAVQALQQTLADWNTKGMDVVTQETQAWLKEQGYALVARVPSSAVVLSTVTTEIPTIAKTLVDEATTRRDQLRTFLDVNGDELSAQYDMLRSILIYDFSEVQADFGIRFAEIFGDSNVDMYKDLMTHSRTGIRAYAETYLNPRVIAETKLGIKFPAEDLAARVKSNKH